jgi:HAD superfamily hydrolase (TIGR01509 family)
MRGAIFDVDGTLLDSMTVWWDVVIDFYKLHGEEISDEEAAGYKELTLNESLPMIRERLGLESSNEELSDTFKQMAALQYENTLPLKDGAREYLKKLHESGVKIAIATSGYEELCKKAFSRLGVWEYIDACAFSSEVGVNKSNPDVYLLAAERIGVKPEECTVFEDIVTGINGAKKGGFKTCAVYDATNAEETDILKKTADSYIKTWYELMQ